MNAKTVLGALLVSTLVLAGCSKEDVDSATNSVKETADKVGDSTKNAMDKPGVERVDARTLRRRIESLRDVCAW